MIIENYPLERDFKKEYFYNGVIFDTCVLLVFFLDKYVKLHSDKRYIFKKIKISEQQIKCLNTIIINLKLSKIIITPYILAEFLSRIRSDLKKDYQDIKRVCLEDLKKFEGIIIKKKNLLLHDNFIKFGNDISMVLANEEQIKSFKHSCIMSFDGRFIQHFFKEIKDEVLAFDLSILQYFF